MCQKRSNTGVFRICKIVNFEVEFAVVGRVAKMLLDTRDLEFLKLTGLCRYMPTGLNRKYDSPCFARRVISNLQTHRLIKLISDKMSYKLTKKGRGILEEIGITFLKDARTNLKKNAYLGKLKNAHINVMLHLAGVNVFYETARELSGISCGYMSSLVLRSDNSMKVLSSAKFLGILKLELEAYIPYYVEERRSWMFPVFEREMYRSQVDSIRDVREIKLILFGDTLEELWLNITPTGESTEIIDGRKSFHISLEEIGSEYLLIPLGRDGVLQLKLLTLCGYKERISKALRCEENNIQGLLECDGWKDKMPFIIGIDFNIKRVLRGLKQIEKYDSSLKPVVACLPFQKSTYLKILKEFSTIKPLVFPISLNDIYNVFPEIREDDFKIEPVPKKRGDYIEVPEVSYSKTQIEVIEV